MTSFAMGRFHSNLAFSTCQAVVRGIVQLDPQFRNPTNSLRSLRSKPPRMRFLLFKLAFCHILTDMSA